MEPVPVTDAVVDRLERAVAQLLRELGEQAPGAAGVFVIEIDEAGSVTVEQG